jgi:hypothetical protein
MNIKKYFVMTLIIISMILMGIPNISAENAIIKSNVENLNIYNMVLINEPPHKPCNIYPINNSVDISINVNLTVCCYDPNGDPMDIYFYNAENDTLIGIDEDVSLGFHGEIEWQNLDYNTTYSWYAIANDSEFENKSDTWNFKTIENNMDNNPPNQPTNPNPSHEQIDVNNNPVLSVVVSDPDDDSLNVSFYNASDDSLIGVDNNVASGGTASVVWSDLGLNSTYYWYVVVNDSKEENTSNEWIFKTINIKLKIDISGGVGINALISNIGDDDAINVEWDINVESKTIFGLIDETSQGNIDLIVAKDDIIAKKLLVRGIGLVDITINADCEYASQVTETANALLLWYFIILY